MTKKKILIVWPPEEYIMLMHTKVPKRWAYLAEIVSYLNKHFPGIIQVIDCLDSADSTGEVLAEIATGRYFALIMVSRFESTPSLLKISHLAKTIDPQIKTLIYGDVCALTPNFHKKNGAIDAIVLCGDWEIGVSDYLNFLLGKIQLADVRGVEIWNDNKWHTYRKGGYLLNNSWELPNLDSPLFPMNTYNRLTKNELTLSVSRGCPFNCKFCSAVATFGLEDRRKTVPEIIAYLISQKEKVDSFKFFSPTFTCNKAWVKELCRGIIKANLKISWCATTRPDQLDDQEMVELMAASGCYKIAIGVETMDADSTQELDKYKGSYEETVKEAVLLLTKYKIKVNALLMLGVKGQTAENIKLSYGKLIEWGASLRSAAYSPREVLKGLDEKNLVSLSDITELDKMTYVNYKIPGITKQQFLQLIFNTADYKHILRKT